MKARIIVILLLCAQSVFAQKTPSRIKDINPYALVDSKALQLLPSPGITTQSISEYITANFTTDSDKARAIFIWTATNIQYDIDNMYAINFYEKKEDKINKPLKTGKGICENYAAVFNDVCIRSGLKSVMVSGYTKQNGFADYIPHAWCATLINGSWFLFDPTWGSGYVNNGKFIKKIDNSYYKVMPSKFIKAHMPFDPMWEFLNYPVTNQEFYEGNIQENKSKPFFSYTDSIAAYDALSEVDQYAATARRIEGNGVKNAMVFDRLQHLKREIEIYNNNKQVAAGNAKVEQYNSAVAEYNDGINDFNTFIEYRNHQFKPMKPDCEIQAMFDAGYNKIIAAKNKLTQIKEPGASITALMVSLQKSINDALANVEEQKEWLAKYFSKGKFGRSTMFTKFTWMGIPMN